MTQQPQEKSDGRVDSYERVVNGRVIKVGGYAKGKASPDSSAALRALKVPGRPRMQAKPGSYSRGRSIPGQRAVPPKPKVVDDEQPIGPPE